MSNISRRIGSDGFCHHNIAKCRAGKCCSFRYIFICSFLFSADFFLYFPHIFFNGTERRGGDTARIRSEWNVQQWTHQRYFLFRFEQVFHTYISNINARHHCFIFSSSKRLETIHTFLEVRITAHIAFRVYFDFLESWLFLVSSLFCLLFSLRFSMADNTQRFHYILILSVCP